MAEKKPGLPERAVNNEELFERTSLALGSNVLRMLTLLTIAQNYRSYPGYYGQTQVRESLLDTQGNSPGWAPDQTSIDRQVANLDAAELINIMRIPDDSYTRYGYAIDLRMTADGSAIGVPLATALALWEDKHRHTSLPFLMGERSGCMLRLSLFEQLLGPMESASQDEISKSFDEDSQHAAYNMLDTLRNQDIVHTVSKFDLNNSNVTISQPTPMPPESSRRKKTSTYNSTTAIGRLTVAMHKTADHLYASGVRKLSYQQFLDVLTHAHPHIVAEEAYDLITSRAHYERVPFVTFESFHPSSLRAATMLSINPQFKEAIRDLLDTRQLCKTDKAYRKHMRTTAFRDLLSNEELVSGLLAKAKLSARQPNSRQLWLAAIQATVPKGGMETKEVYDAITTIQPRMTYKKFSEMVRAFNNEGHLRLDKGRFAERHNRIVGWVTLNAQSDEEAPTKEE